MATISSLGIGSGLDSESIVTKLAALEKAPLKTLETQATLEKAQISAFGTIQSQFSALTDVATRLSSSTGWIGRTASSSNTSVATIDATETAAPTSFTLDVDRLAQKQSISSAAYTTNSLVGAGTMTFRLGTWTGASVDAASDNAGVSSADAAVVSAQAVLTNTQTDLTIAEATQVTATTNLTAATADLTTKTAARDLASNDLTTANTTLSSANATLATSTTALSDANAAASNALLADGAGALDLTNYAATNPYSGAPTTQTALNDYASSYRTWVDAVAANDGVTQTLIDAETTALTNKNAAYTALGTADPAAQANADALTATADATDASALKSAARTASATYNTDLTNQANAATAVTNATTALTDAQTAMDAAATAEIVATTALTAADAAVASATAAVTAATTTLNAATAAAATSRPVFTAATGSVDVTITADGTDTIATLAAKINTANAGVVATVFFDGSQERLLLASKNTGADAGFRVQVSDTGDSVDTDNNGLSRFAYDPQNSAYGMATSGIPAKYGQDALARINGLAVTSKTNTFTNNIPGVTVTVAATTTTGYGTVSEARASIAVAVREDVTPSVKNVQDFVTAYNALNASLADLTKYDAATKTPSLFQGDAAVLGMQSILRGMLGSISNGSTYSRLSDVGLERKLDGSLSLNTSKLSAAANNGTELVKLFTLDNKNGQTNGFALKFAAFGKGVLATGGAVSNKAAALQKTLDRNGVEQTRINDRAALTEARLRRQYSALDAKMASLTALNAYVSQQVTSWNKSTG